MRGMNEEVIVLRNLYSVLVLCNIEKQVKRVIYYVCCMQYVLVLSIVNVLIINIFFYKMFIIFLVYMYNYFDMNLLDFFCVVYVKLFLFLYMYIL